MVRRPRSGPGAECVPFPRAHRPPPAAGRRGKLSAARGVGNMRATCATCAGPCGPGRARRRTSPRQRCGRSLHVTRGASATPRPRRGPSSFTYRRQPPAGPAKRRAHCYDTLHETRNAGLALALRKWRCRNGPAIFTPAASPASESAVGRRLLQGAATPAVETP